VPPYTCDTVSVSELHVTLCPSKQYAPCPTLGDTQKSPQPTTLRSGSGRQPPPSKGLADVADRVIHRTVNPRLLSSMSSNDVASIISQALPPPAAAAANAPSVGNAMPHRCAAECSTSFQGLFNSTFKSRGVIWATACAQVGRKPPLR